MRALVTGAAGFVGRHMMAELDRRGYSTVGIDVTPAGDLAMDIDANHFFATSTYHFDLIVHAAASAPHRAAIDGQAEHLARNLQLDSAMFDWALRTGQGRILYLSSSAAYPITYQGAVDERVRHVLTEDMIDLDFLEPPDADYGFAKLAGERMAAAARRKGLAVTVVRPFSGYGEDQTENFPFRAITERARSRANPFEIWGHGEQVRDWIHISDVVNGALAVAESGTTEPVNLCTGVGHTMTELARLACEAVGHQTVFEYRADKPSGVPYRVGDPSLFHQFYTPKVTFEEGVSRALT